MFDLTNKHDAVYKSEVPSEEHKGKWTHELVGGAAGFAAMRAYEEHQARQGKPANHPLAKQLIAGLAGVEIDKLIESKGLSFIDREKAKDQAKKDAEHLYEQKYEQNN
ncbi:hypothetical protein INT43_004906 [Umbelopsis isabellina]|uniref:CipC-like antibiotic response protein n=1 Tax=Mortierella isabellina TaxID=91625 RepID=A0A8H7PEC4_MORIS|nr:hypothetical protein INT43_004906 [Umbelopsis isabellina]